MSNRLTWEYLTQTATKAYRSWSPKQVAQFHYFNPNGLYAAKKARDERISQAVDAGLCKSGAILAYGSFNDFCVKNLGELACDSKRPTDIQVRVAVDMLEADIAKQDAFLASLPSNP